METNDIVKDINEWMRNMEEFLLAKNALYGNSVMEPLGIFSKHISAEHTQATNGILARLDDKLKRIKNANKLRTNDVVDLYGYLTFLCISMNIEKHDLDSLLD